MACPALHGSGTDALLASLLLSPPSPQEYEEFQEKWLRLDFPQWLAERRPGIADYSTLVGNSSSGRQPSSQGQSLKAEVPEQGAALNATPAVERVVL